MLTTAFQTIFKSEESLDITKDRKYCSFFNALGDSTRFSILKFLIEEQGACVSDIAQVFEISIPAASQQLKILDTSGLLIRRRMGRNVCYEINKHDESVQALIDIITP